MKPRHATIVKPIAPFFDPEPVRYRRHARIPFGALRTTVGSLCARAGIQIRATYDRPVYLCRGKRRVRTPTFDIIGVDAPRSRLGAMRALEALAHVFHEPTARHCMCGHGYFDGRLA